MAVLLGGCASDDDNDESDEESTATGSSINEDDESLPDADGDGTPDSQDDFPDDPQLTEELRSISRTYRISEDDYAYQTFDFSGDTRLTYDLVVRDGPSIDAVWFTRDEFDQYQLENRARYDTLVSSLNTQNARVDRTVSSGSYVLVLDNTNMGEASPPTNFDDDVATVELELVVAQ